MCLYPPYNIAISLDSVRVQSSPLASSVADGGLRVRDTGHGSLKVMVILLSELHHASLSVKSLSDDLVGLHELVDFAS